MGDKFFDDFYLFKCEPWIDEWLLLKHFYNHFINVYTCLYVDGVWIGVVVCEVWMKMNKYDLLVKNELDDDFDENWCYDSIFIIVLIAFWCMLTIKQVWGRIWVKADQNRVFWEKFGWVPERKPKNRVPCSSATHQASLWLAGGKLLSSAPLFLERFHGK